MTIDDWELIKSVFARAIEMPTDERTEFVANELAGRNNLIAEVTSLLDSADEPENLIENNGFDLNSRIISGQQDYTDKHFGNYRIISEIGHGGMGTVFLAERDDGEFSMQVALKIVRQSIADRQIIERFKRERQILAGLKHPNIAALFDGGVSEKGEPFLAMEYIEGKTLTNFSRENELNIRDRLQLFLKVCNAVDFAHRNLVVHRDIKPANILITADGEPKLLDFGLARSFEIDSSATQTTLRAFTPAYASPEQILGKNLTTATDIYSLGVVLFELISGKKPFEVDGLNYEQVVRTLANHDPSTPSSIAINTKGDRDVRVLDGDLDNIALMSIRKEPERRYASVSALADDIRAHLDGRPISARPNTFGYLASRFVKRNKIAVTAACLILISVFAGLGIAFWQANVARRESARSDAVNKFMQQMLLTADPAAGSGGKRGAEATIVDILKQAETRLDNGELATEPDVRADVRQLIGNGFRIQGAYDDAARALAASFEEKAAIYGRESTGTLTNEIDLARLYLAKADYGRANEIFKRRFDQFRSEMKRGNIEPIAAAGALADHGVGARATGDFALAELLIREAIDVTNSNGIDGMTTGNQTMLSLILFDQGRFDEAKLSQQTQLDKLKQKGSIDESTICSALTLLGSIQMESGELHAATDSLKQSEVLYRRLFGNETTALYDNLRLQAQVAYLQGSYSDAKKTIDIVLDKYTKNSNPKYISYATALTVKALILNKLGDGESAEAVIRDALQLRKDNLPPDNFMTALTKSAAGEILTDRKQYGEAELLLRDALGSLETSQKTVNSRITMTRDRLARLETAKRGG